MATFKIYLLGFILAIFLTLAAYIVVVFDLLSGPVLGLTIIALALIQLWVQLVFFLHVGERGKNWNLAALVSTLSIIAILVLASVWIMNNLNYRHSTDAEIFHEEGINK